MSLDRVNQILARAVLAAGIIFVTGSVIVLALTGIERLLILTAFGAVASGYAASHLSRMKADENASTSERMVLGNAA